MMRITTIEGKRHYSGTDPLRYAEQRRALIEPKGGESMFKFLAKLALVKRLWAWWQAGKGKRKNNRDRG